MRMHDWLKTFPEVRLLHFPQDKHLYEEFTKTTAMRSGLWYVNLIRHDFWNPRDLRFGFFNSEEKMVCVFSIRIQEIEFETGRKVVANIGDMRVLQTKFSRTHVVFRKLYRALLQEWKQIEELKDIELWISAVLSDNEAGLNTFTKGKGNIIYDVLDGYWVQIIPFFGLGLTRSVPSHSLVFPKAPAWFFAKKINWYWIHPNNGLRQSIPIQWLFTSIRVRFGSLCVLAYGSLNRSKKNPIKILGSVMKKGTLYSVRIADDEARVPVLKNFRMDYL